MQKFEEKEKVVICSGFGYDLGVFLGEGETYDTYKILPLTGVLAQKECNYNKTWINKFSESLLNDLKKYYGY